MARAVCPRPALLRVDFRRAVDPFLRGPFRVNDAKAQPGLKPHYFAEVLQAKEQKGESWPNQNSPSLAALMSVYSARRRRRIATMAPSIRAAADIDTAFAPPGTVEQPPTREPTSTSPGIFGLSSGGLSVGISSQLPSQATQRVPVGQRVQRQGSSTHSPARQRPFLHCFSGGRF